MTRKHRPTVGIIGNSHLMNDRYTVHAAGLMNSAAVSEVADCLPLIVPSDPRVVSVEELMELCDGFLLDSTSQGAPGIDFARWKKPVLAGDTLTGKCLVVGRRESKSRPGIGFATIRSELTNQRGEVVLDLQNTGMFQRRDAA